MHAHEEYDNLGPICDLSLDSIAAGNMRLLRHKRDRKLYAGKIIPRPKVLCLACPRFHILKQVLVYSVSAVDVLASAAHADCCWSMHFGRSEDGSFLE